MIYKIVTGMLVIGTTMRAQPIAVRFTSDSRGETLSLGDDNGVQITVPFEVVEKMIKTERAKRRS